MPVADESQLYDPEIRENFIERLFFWRRWRELLTKKPGLGDLVAFHTRHKYQLLAHSTEHYRQMGPWVARGRELAMPQLLAGYQALALAALQLKATASKNANVLYHLLGYFKKQLRGTEKQEVLEAIDSYRRGEAPLIVPLTLINHYVREISGAVPEGANLSQPASPGTEAAESCLSLRGTDFPACVGQAPSPVRTAGGDCPTSSHFINLASRCSTRKSMASRSR